MKAISLWQPWASWVALGFKKIETRTHDRFKGLAGERIAIHAAMRFDGSAFDMSAPFWKQNGFSIGSKLLTDKKDYPSGCLICMAYVYETRWLQPADGVSALIECDTPRFGLVLHGVKILNPFILCKGRQGIFNVDIEK